MSSAASTSPARVPTRTKGLLVSGWAAIAVAASVGAWLLVLVFMAGMDEGPGTPLHSLPVFLVGWSVMLTAMMLPSELNYIGAFRAMLKARKTDSAFQRRLMASFISGYGVAWVGYGLLAFALDWAVRAVSPEVLRWDRYGPFLAGAVLVGAGFYQVSSLKHSCLMGCRSPLAFFARYWQGGAYGALSMGTRHGLVCVGCCWALMGVMFAVGAMSLTWMSLLTVFMFAEKMLPKGEKLAIPIASFLWIMGAWVAVAPASAPLLKQPMLLASICRGIL